MFNLQKQIKNFCIAYLLIFVALISDVSYAITLSSDRVYYDKDNYYKSTWQWLDINSDGLYECYYFNMFGHIYKNGKTPDGYYVNEKGEWVVDNQVQYKTLPELQNMYNVIASSSILNSTISTNNYMKELKDEFVEKLNECITESIKEVEYYIELKEVDKKLLSEIEGNVVKQLTSIYNNYYSQAVKLLDEHNISKNELELAKKVINEVLKEKEKILNSKFSEIAKKITWILEPNEYKEYRKIIMEEYYTK